jgi:ATPase subunit of ABC transporter with duplicated ATPase domains
LRALGLDDAQIAAPLDTLSGGERSRVALARALLSDATVLLLDEPDCHLDVDGIAWLERALCRHRGALLLVTHDRDLLDRVVDGIVEVEDGKVTCERGNVSDYLAHKTERVQRQKQEYLEQQRRVRKLQAAISRQAGTARGIELRTIHFHYRKKALKTARRAVVLKRRIERELGEARRVERPVERRPGARLDLAPRRWDARTVLRLDGIHKAYGERHVLRDVSLELPRGQRVALVGANGTGKTTLLEVALGRLPADAGDVWLSQGARPFYCDQHKGGLEPGLTVFETIQKHTGLGRNQTHHLLARLLFTGDALDTPVEALSGGERTRLVLALLMNAQADLLLLDEPTNHLDLPGIEVLQAALAQYEGALLFVSHDRRLVRSVATHVVELCDGRLVRQPRPVD